MYEFCHIKSKNSVNWIGTSLLLISLSYRCKGSFKTLVVMYIVCLILELDFKLNKDTFSFLYYKLPSMY